MIFFFCNNQAALAQHCVSITIPRHLRARIRATLPPRTNLFDKSNLEHNLQSYQRVDALVRQIVIGGGVVLDHFAVLGVVALSNLVDLEAGKKTRDLFQHVSIVIGIDIS